MFRTLYLPIGIFILAVAGCSQQATENLLEQDVAKAAALDTDGQKLSYGLGLNIGSGVLKQGIPGLDIEALVAGLRDSISGGEARISEEELQAVLTRVSEEEETRIAEMAAENSKLSTSWFEENGKKAGVVTTDSGLQYEVLTEGDGASPVAESVVKTHYHGTLLDGTVFDSSVERGEPAQFPLNQVIPGWTEALQLMKVGGKHRIYLPAALAYGDYSPGASIPPGSALIFEIELLEIINE